MTMISWLSFSRSLAIMMAILISMAIVSMTIPMSMVIVWMIGISCCFSFRLSITQDCYEQAESKKNLKIVIIEKSENLSALTTIFIFGS